MSKNTAKLAQAISLLSDVLARDAACDSIEDMETAITNEYDDLKEQALEFGRDVADDLSDISNDLDRALDLTADDEADDVDFSYNPTWEAPPGWDDTDDDYNDDTDTDTNADDDAGNGEVDISDTESDVDDGDAIDIGTAEPTADEKVQTLMDRIDELTSAEIKTVEKIAELETDKDTLDNKIEDLTNALRVAVTEIENLNGATDTFVSEVETL